VLSLHGLNGAPIHLACFTICCQQRQHASISSGRGTFSCLAMITPVSATAIGANSGVGPACVWGRTIGMNVGDRGDLIAGQNQHAPPFRRMHWVTRSDCVRRTSAVLPTPQHEPHVSPEQQRHDRGAKVCSSSSPYKQAEDRICRARHCSRQGSHRPTAPRQCCRTAAQGFPV